MGAHVGRHRQTRCAVQSLRTLEGKFRSRVISHAGPRIPVAAASQDGLRTAEHSRVMVLAATNRPFDLDEAVIRRLPRRLMVDLPDVQNRERILRVILAKEELDGGAEAFPYDQVAAATDGCAQYCASVNPTATCWWQSAWPFRCVGPGCTDAGRAERLWLAILAAGTLGLTSRTSASRRRTARSASCSPMRSATAPERRHAAIPLQTTSPVHLPPRS